MDIGLARLRRFAARLPGSRLPAPPRDVPPELRDSFTRGGRVPLLEHYCDDTVSKPLRWEAASKWWNVERAAARELGYYGQTDAALHQALDAYPIENRSVVIVGSQVPWYECICSVRNASVTTIEYRPIRCTIPGLRVLTWDEFDAAPARFDAALSVSSIEHDGLGRYGDPLDPEGDLGAMARLRDLLEPRGLLYLSVPVGADAVVWNAHRIYGRRRLPELLDGWERVASFHFSDELFDAKPGEYVEPIFVLRPVSGS